ncbi:hypothetical protein MHY1_p00138 (plasmid) [Methylovirgula sp. HY1]|jgi:hypothetical protein|nr:hypothetical protein MHY1_p00138 [Methylovirgula sp. HY1]
MERRKFSREFKVEAVRLNPVCLVAQTNLFRYSLRGPGGNGCDPGEIPAKFADERPAGGAVYVEAGRAASREIRELSQAQNFSSSGAQIRGRRY